MADISIREATARFREKEKKQQEERAKWNDFLDGLDLDPKDREEIEHTGEPSRSGSATDQN